MFCFIKIGNNHKNVPFTCQDKLLRGSIFIQKGGESNSDNRGYEKKSTHKARLQSLDDYFPTYCSFYSPLFLFLFISRFSCPSPYFPFWTTAAVFSHFNSYLSWTKQLLLNVQIHTLITIIILLTSPFLCVLLLSCLSFTLDNRYSRILLIFLRFRAYSWVFIRIGDETNKKQGKFVYKYRWKRKEERKRK